MQYMSHTQMTSNCSPRVTGVSHAATHDIKHIQSVMSTAHKYHN